MNLNNLNNLIELFVNQANKQNKKDIFLEWLNPSNKKTYTWEQTEKNILKLSKVIKENIKEIVFMGGAAMCLGNTTPSAEFNIYVDPHAANIVLESGIPLTMMGLDVTHQVNVNSKIIKSMNENKNKSSKFFGELMEFYTKFHK